MARRRDHGLARQLCPVQEEQQRDGDVGEMIDSHRGSAAAWQQARQDEHPDQRQGEVVRQELDPGHR
jgi:hypothetical protein